MDCEFKLTENWRSSLRKWKRYVCNNCWCVRQSKYAKSDPDRNLKKKRQLQSRRESWSDERKQQEKNKSYNRTLLKKYGITLDVYNSMLQIKTILAIFVNLILPKVGVDFT